MENKEKMRECMKCKKMKPEKDGFLKLGGVFFCCKSCCDKDAKGQKANTCEFC